MIIIYLIWINTWWLFTNFSPWISLTYVKMTLECSTDMQVFAELIRARYTDAYGNGRVKISGWGFDTYYIIYIYILVGGLDLFLFSIIYGMSSFALTNSYFSRWLKPPTSIYYVYVYYIPGRTDATAGRSCTNWWWKTRYLAMACNVHAQGRHCKSLKLVYGKCGHVKRGCLKFENIKILENILQSIDFSLSHIYIYIHIFIYMCVYLYIII